MNPVVVAVAITGSVPRKKDNPAVPITVAEQIESTSEAYEAGAALVHIHVRNDDETSSSDPERFAAVRSGGCPRRYSVRSRLAPEARMAMVSVSAAEADW